MLEDAAFPLPSPSVSDEAGVVSDPLSPLEGAAYGAGVSAAAALVSSGATSVLVGTSPGWVALPSPSLSSGLLAVPVAVSEGTSLAVSALLSSGLDGVGTVAREVGTLDVFSARLLEATTEMPVPAVGPVGLARVEFDEGNG